MKKIFKPLLLISSLFIGFLQAQNVLFITTTDDPNIINNAYDEFNNYTTATITDQRNTLGVVGNVPNFAGYDIVVVIAVYNQLSASEITTLENAVITKESKSFILFFDGCDICGSNAQNMVDILNTTNSAGFTATLGTQVFSPSSGSDYITTPSPLASGFASPLIGYYYTPFSGIPAGNIIYTDTNGNDTTFAVPITESKGACLFGMTDTSIFDNNGSPPPILYANNAGKIGPAFIDAAMSQQGSCYLRSTPDQVADPARIPSVGLFALIMMTLSLLAITTYKRKRK